MSKKSAKSKHRLLKVVLLGDGGVGKSSLMNRFVSDRYNGQSFHTIGVEFLNKEVSAENGENFTLQIWDTAGQERFKSLRTPFYRGADCCLLTFSVDDSASFRNLLNWRKEFLHYADVSDPDSFPFVVLGNKVDIAEREVTSNEAQLMCSSNGAMPYYETSAKDSTNVETAFKAAVNRVVQLENSSKGTILLGQSDRLDLSRKKQNGNCC